MKKFGIVLGASFLMTLTSFGADTPPEGVTLVDLTDTIGSRHSISEYLQGYQGAFDNDTKTGGGRWLAKGTSSWVIWDFGEGNAQVVNAYRIMPAWASYYEAARNPKDFVLLGKNEEPSVADGWTTLDARSNESMESGKWYFYLGTNTASYRYYKLSVTKNNGSNQYTGIQEIEFCFVPPPGAPKIVSSSVIHSANDTFTAYATLGDAAAVVKALAYAADDAEPIVSSMGEVAAESDGSVVLAGLAAGVSYKVNFAAENNVYSRTNVNEAAIYSGTPTLAKVSDGQELGCVPVKVQISRAAADPYPLEVHYSVSSSDGVAGTDYVVPSGVATIPANSTGVVVEVVPLLNPEKTSDTTITVSLAEGLYHTTGAQSVDALILNAVVPDDANYWIAGSSSDGLASTASNWSKGIPRASASESLVICIDGTYAAKSMTWDADGTTELASTVTSWTQAANYSGTVTFKTTFAQASSTFKTFTVTGDMIVNGGKITHPQSIYQTSGQPYSLAEMRANAIYRLCLNVGGNLSLGTGASIDAASKGYWRYATGYNINGSHGGWRNGATQDSTKGNCAPYGNPKEPIDIGSCTCVGTDGASKSAPGGGAIYVTVGETATINGVMSADGNGHSSGGSSAGSVYLRAKIIAGAGSIHASGVKPSSDKEAGAGGRVAVVSDTTISESLALAATSAGAYYSGAGTVFVKDGSMTNGKLIVANTISTQTGVSARTPVTSDGDWTFDSVVVGSCGRLAVPNGLTLTLPGGLASVSSSDTSSPYDGIYLMRGGAINMGTGDQTMSGGWTFASVDPFVFPADLTLQNGARLGLFRFLQSGTNNTLKCDYTIKGDLSVATGCSVDVSQIYHTSGANAVYPQAAHGGWSTYVNASKGYPLAINTYGSVFNPNDFGSTPTKGFYGSGALKLTVEGTLTLDGSIAADGASSNSTYDGCPAAPGGSINMTIGSLAGTGSITAIGGAGRYNYAGGAAGGRIAIKLMEAGATFPEGITVNAQGRYGYAFDVACNKIGSAGTIYVETAAEGAKGGMVIISNWKDRTISEFTSATIIPTTPIVARLRADDAVDFKKAALLVTNNAIAEVSVPELKMRSLVIAENSKLDLSGKTFIVGSAKLGGTKLKAGTYKATDEAVASFVVDSAGIDGQLIVKPRGLVILIQ